MDESISRDHLMLLIRAAIDQADRDGETLVACLLVQARCDKEPLW